MGQWEDQVPERKAVTPRVVWESLFENLVAYSESVASTARFKQGSHFPGPTLTARNTLRKVLARTEAAGF